MKNNFKPFSLRSDLLLGVATAATQIEGGDTNNQWYDWTKNGDKTKDGTNTLRANRHYINYRKDIDLMSEMGLQIYRMSVEWSRIQPTSDTFNIEAMNHYIDEIDYLLEKGIKPLVTLHHFSNPIWFEEKGAFLQKDSPNIFLKYVKYVVEHLKDKDIEICTINEPNVYAVNSYLYGFWPPQVKSFCKMRKVLRNLCKSHILAFNAIKKINPSMRVGFAMNLGAFHPQNKYNPFYNLETLFYRRSFNHASCDAMGFGKFHFPIGFFGCKKGKYFDFIGINYYSRSDVAHFKQFPHKRYPKNDLGWAIYPEGISELCLEFHKRFDKAEIYITENGTADKKDAFRSKYIYDHVKMINDLDFVKRYYHWTLMDNFEWAEGESGCFGLIEYDYENDVKKIRPSGIFYSELIKNRGVNND